MLQTQHFSTLLLLLVLVVDVDALETYLTQIINSFLYDDGDDVDNDGRIVVTGH